MLDFGFTELLMIAAVLVMVIGPKQLPEIMFSLGRIMRRLSYMRFALSRQFEDFMQDMEREKAQQNPNGQSDSLQMLPREGQSHPDGDEEEEEDEDFAPASYDLTGMNDISDKDKDKDE